MLVDKLKTARKSAGLSLRDLQAKIGNAVTAQAIGKYERGEMQPGPKVLGLLATALGVSKEYLSTTGGIQLRSIEFRENFTKGKKEEALAKASVLNQIQRYLEIEELLHVETVEWDEPEEFPFPVSDLKDAEVAAYKLRDDWKLGNDPITNLAEFLEDRGIKVISMSLPESIAGVMCSAYLDNQKKVPAIVLNKNTTGERQRFTLAHELGHLVLECSNLELSAEKACHRFASAFLMPYRILWATLGKHRQSVSLGELVSLKKFFGVSIQALTYRCKDLNIISQSMYRNLYAEYSKRGWLEPPYDEPERIQPEETHRFRRLCFRALAEEVISRDKAAQLLGIDAEQIIPEMNYE
jgi:Zn-dependent peptidase ImmA (M78 family)